MNSDSIEMDSNVPKIVLISATPTARNMVDAIIEVHEKYGKIFQFKLYIVSEIEHDSSTLPQLKNDIIDAQTILVDIRGNSPVIEMVVDTLTNLRKTNQEEYDKKTIIALVGGNQEIRELTKLGSFSANKIPSKKNGGYNFDSIPELTDLVEKGIKISDKIQKFSKSLPFGLFKHIRNWYYFMDYWTYGHSGVPENLIYMLELLLRTYLGFKQIPKPKKPKKIPNYGIFDPLLNQYFPKLDDYLKAKPINPNRQTIGIFYYGGIYFEQSIPVIAEFMKCLNKVNIIPLYSETLDNITAIESFFFKDSKCLVNAVINLQYFQINGGPFGGNNSRTLELYKKMNVPQFNPIINFDMTIENYMQHKAGMYPINQIIAIVMPELDGRIEMMMAGHLDSIGFSEEIDGEVYEIYPYKKNVELISNRIIKWMDLRIKPNSEKKVCIILYDYPPGEENLGNASYLDTINSLTKITKKLEVEGYDTGNLNKIIENLGKDNKRIDTLFLKNSIINDPSHISLANFHGVSISSDKYREVWESLPLVMKNQVAESWGDIPGEIMVNNNNILLPILKFGKLLLGIQPSRSNILNDVSDYHNTELPPHHQYIMFYKYLEEVESIDAIIHLGTHGTPEFMPGKEVAGHIYDWNIYLQGKIPNIYIYHITNTSESAIAKRRLNAVIVNHSTPPLQISGLNEDLQLLENNLTELNQNADSTESQEQLKQNIESLANKYDLKYMNYNELEQQIYRMKLSAIPNGLHVFGNPFGDELKRDMILNILLHGPESLNLVDNLEVKYGKRNSKFLDELNILISNVIRKSEPLSSKNAGYNLEEYDHFKNWVLNLSSLIDQSIEMENLIRSLEGGYIEPGVGGDPIRNYETFPTGRNSFGFDPRLIPSSNATIRGNNIAEQSLKSYYENNSKWPETVSVVLWAFETMKTGGETIGQIFNYLGVRAVKEKSIWTTELELIPLQEMTHPRINPLITICGIFRDTFPNLINLIDNAVQLVIDADEPLDKNFVKKYTQKLCNSGIEKTNARIFGPAPGKYNTNLTDIIGGANWKYEEELAEDYLKNMSHVYSNTEQGVLDVNSFRTQISYINIISQIRDSSEFHITDLDHYYEFTGGLAKSYKYITKNDPNIIIADTSSNVIQISDLKQSINEGVLTRNLNPKWINGMLKHAFHGGQKVSERLENLMGFSSTTKQVDNWVWEKSFETYIENEDIKNQLIENNQFAVMDLIETFLEAEQRGYWETSEENIEKLKKLYLELDNWVEMNYSE